MFGEIDYSLPNPQRLSRILPGATSSDIQQYSHPSPYLYWRYYSLDFLLNNFNIMPNNETTFFNSSSTNYSSHSPEIFSTDDEISDSFLYLMIPLYSLVFVIGTIGNILVILTVVTVKQMRNTTNALILHLAIANLSFVLMCIPHTIYLYVAHSYSFPGFLCKLANTLMYLCAYVSIYILVLMSIDRFLGVVFAVKSTKYRIERNAHLAVVFVWLIGIIFASPNMFFYDAIHNPSSDAWLCIFREDNPFLNTARLITAYIFAVFGLIIPLIVIGILYGLIINVLRKNAKGKQVAKGKKRVTKMVSAVISSFVICWTPMQINLLYTHHKQVKFLVAIVAQSLAYISSCVNPILYAFLSEPFRKAFKQFLTCSKILGNHSTNQNGTETTLSRQKSTHYGIQRQQQAKKLLPLKSNMNNNNNNNHRTKAETIATDISSETVKYDQLSNKDTTTNIN